jgi:flagellar biosynthesis protein FlhB
MHYYPSINLVKPTVTICSKGKQHNLVCIFRSYILFFMILEVVDIFYEYIHYYEILKKEIKRKTTSGPNLTRGRRPIGRGGLL